MKRTQSTEFSESLALPEYQRMELCKDVLNQLGANIRSVNEHSGEIVYSCMLSAGHNDQDRNPTASLNYKKLLTNCLGCKASGTVLWLIGVVRGLTKAEATQEFSALAGLDGYVMDVEHLLTYLEGLYDRQAPEAIPSFSLRTLDPWRFIHPYLTDPKPLGRGIPQEQVERFQLGYAQDYKIGKQTSERIIIPHFWRGSLVGWQARKLDNGDTSKYINSFDFPKQQTIFNYRSKAPVTVLTEAPLSAVAHDRPDFHVEATFGATITDTQVRLLSSHPKVVLFLDNDSAGWSAVEGVTRKEWGKKATHREGLAEKLSAYSNVFVVNNPYEADPADLSHETVRELVDQAVPYSIWQRPKQLQRIGA